MVKISIYREDVEIIDQNGDMLLKIAGLVTCFKISLAVLRLTHTAWADARPRTVDVLRKDLSYYKSELMPMIEPGDCTDPDAMRIILLVAHLQFRRIPETLDIAALGRLARFCEEKDLTDLLSSNLVNYERRH